MARRELSPPQLAVVQAVQAVLPGGPVVVGCSGGADSMALALGAQHAGAELSCVVVDHGLQEGSAEVARQVVQRLGDRGLRAKVRRVEVAPDGEGLEAAARDARLAALASDGFPVLLGHTLDDQAETVLLGLFRGSGLRSLAGMATHRGLFVRPLLGLRRELVARAVADWGIEVWQDPHNGDPRFARVRARRALALLAAELGRDLAPALARTAELARADADLLDALAPTPAAGPLPVDEIRDLPDALRMRALHRWLTEAGSEVTHAHVRAVDQLVTAWRGQGPVAVPGARVERSEGLLYRRPTR